MRSNTLIAAIAAAILGAAPASAADFSINKDVGAGTFTLLDSNPAYGVTEVLVQEIGFGIGNATSLPGWTAAQVLFGADPLSCQSDTGSTITLGFCYKLTNPSLGVPITTPSTTFTYDPAGDDPALPSQFALLFQTQTGLAGCSGNTGSGGGCGAAVPEPPTAGLLAGLVGLLSLLRFTRPRFTRPRAAR